MNPPAGTSPAPTARPVWLREFHGTPDDESAPMVVICPHAGTGASSYRELSGHFSRSTAPVVVQYPGRQDRRTETPAQDVRELAAGTALELVSRDEHRPLILFGHSMGGIVAFETARALEKLGLTVHLLAVSAVVPPGEVTAQPRHPTDDDDIITRLIELGGTDRSVHQNPEMMALTLPVLKSDYAMIDSYSCSPDTRVSCPIVVLGGDRDPVVSPAQLRRWAAHGASAVSPRLFDGSHFYINDNREAVVAATLHAYGDLGPS
ncbi:alpha/beta fold hydrolase [Corynebacterium sp. P7003]|uniref:Thioesterase TesA n=1 Tax=Corynebacterium pygosceleis TaxID=2800406 RepID=A0ABT3WS22_9CORY|nr:alpha/beta fold hydrolase [Corynebacterium pygosceleis]MCX7444986.1 alpha/beta fold hydrolase [Corynebacterium pygosceleis]